MPSILAKTAIIIINITIITTARAGSEKRNKKPDGGQKECIRAHKSVLPYMSLRWTNMDMILFQANLVIVLLKVGREERSIPV